MKSPSPSILLCCPAKQTDSFLESGTNALAGHVNTFPFVATNDYFTMHLNKLSCVRFKIFATVTTNNLVVCDVTPSSMIEYQHPGEDFVNFYHCEKSENNALTRWIQSCTLYSRCILISFCLVATSFFFLSGLPTKFSVCVLSPQATTLTQSTVNGSNENYWSSLLHVKCRYS